MSDEKNVGESTQQSEFENLDARTQSFIKALRKEAEENRIKYEKVNEKLKGIEKAEQEKAEKELVETNKYKDAYDALKKEKSDLEANYNVVLEKATKYEEANERERLELLNKIPDDKREKFKELNKTQLVEVLSLLSKPENSVGTENKGKAEINLDTMSWDEQLKLNKENPELYTKLKLEQFQKLRG